MTGPGYRPSDQALARLAKVDFVAVVGPAAAGKTTVIRAAAERHPGLRAVLTHTSRPPRPGERDGVDYQFQTLAGMRRRIAEGGYVQVAPTVFGALYATAAEDYPTTGVALLPVLSEAIPGFRSLPFRRMRVVYVVPPDPDTWRRRLAERGWDADTTTARMAEAQRSMRFALDSDEVAFVINDDVSVSGDDLVTLARDRRRSDRLRGDQRRSRRLLADLLRETAPTSTM